MYKIFLYSFLVFILAGVFCVIPSYAYAQDVDTDSDGLSDDLEQTIYYTDPNDPDTDGDGYNDGLEIEHGYSPRHGDSKRLREVDSDQDMLWDDWEISLGTDLTNFDTDGDSYHDGVEVQHSYDPNNSEPQKVKKHIGVNIQDQWLEYYLGNKKLDAFYISGGLPRTPTPKGTFNIIKKRPVVNYGGVGFSYPNTKWNLMFTRKNSWGYYVHGAYWHDNFGNPMSHGCINVPHKYEYMGRLYDWADVGTEVVIQ